MIQRPKRDGNWLYEDRGENERYFTIIVALADGAPLWPECTDEKKREWEEEHKPEPETETVESVEQPTE